MHVQYPIKYVRQRLAAFLAALIAACGLAFAVSPPAAAAPGGSGDDGEGGSKSLVSRLESASRGYLEAQDALALSRKRQSDLAARLVQIDKEMGPRQAA